MTRGLLISRQTKFRLAKTAKRSQNALDLEKYVQYRNIYNSLLRKSKKLFYFSKINQCKGKPKQLWDTLKLAMNNSTSSSKIDSILHNEQLINEKAEIADLFNEYFTSIGQKTADEVKDTTIDFKTFLPPSSVHSIFMEPTTPNEILEIISNFESKNSTDINNLSTSLLKNVAQSVLCPLTNIHNLSLRKGEFPDSLKISKTVPVFKNLNVVLSSCQHC